MIYTVYIYIYINLDILYLKHIQFISTIKELLPVH